MNDGVGALEMRHQLVPRDVRNHPLGLRHLERRPPAGDAGHRPDIGVGRERGEHARPDVSARSDDHDPHAGRVPRAARWKPRPLLTYCRRRYLRTQSGTKTSRMPPTQASICHSELPTSPPIASALAVSAVAVTGLTSAMLRSQSGIVSTGTKMELAKTSGKIATKPADCAASGPFAIRPT